MTGIEQQDWSLTKDPGSSPGLKEGAKERLINRYLPLVGMVVARMGSWRGGAVADRDDLLQSGFLGLVRAVELFEPSRGVQFPTYASFRIRGSVLDSLRALDWVPRSLRREAARRELAGEPPLLPICCELDAEALVDPRAHPGVEMELAEERERLRKAVARLPRREKLALEGSYLGGRTLKDISLELKISESRACQIRTRALSRLRHMLES